MVLNIAVLVLSILLTGLIVWVVTSNHYKKQLDKLTIENSALENQAQLNQNIINEVKLAFAEIAKDSLKEQQEGLLNQHSADLKSKIELFKAEEITPINKLLTDFKQSIDNYQKSHLEETNDIKNAISTAEKYAKALTMSQTSKGEFGENWLEQVLTFANLKENVHYIKQYSHDNAKPDIVVKLPDNKSIVIDSKAILKNFIDYQQTESPEYKKAFIGDLNTCITNLAGKNYEEIETLNQPGFILMFIPIENCINMIYTDPDFTKVIELAHSRNIVIIGTSSLIVTLKLINRLWASQIQYDNVQNIITVAENLYNNIASHSKVLEGIQKTIDGASLTIQKEINRFKTRNKGSIFREAEKLREYGIRAKENKSGKKISDNSISEIFLDSVEDETEEENQE
jgi:DNA recombination protein RmuC